MDTCRPVDWTGSRRLGDDAVEEILTSADGLVVAPAEGGAAGFLRVPPDGVQAVRIVHRERAKHVGVEDGEDDRHEAHADRQRQDRGATNARLCRNPRQA